LYVGLPAAVALLLAGKEFTAAVALSIAVATLADQMLKTDLLLQLRTYLFLGLVALLILVFNSYLAWRPIVFYEDAYRLGLRIGVIPIEDFGYGLGLVLLNTVVYKKLKGLRHG
jgi:lycopene cyclase domain-containing protein